MATRATRYEPNYPGVGRVMKGAAMRRMLEAAARRGQAFAESISPRETGQYASSFRVTSTVGADRAAAYLYNDSDHASAVEFQNGSRVLGRTVDAIENGL